MNQRQFAAWAGMLAPVIFVTTFTVEGWLRPGYQPLSMFVSALALGSRGWIQTANFFVFGALLLVFTRGVASEFPTGKAPRLGVILLVLIAILVLAAGFFPMDPLGTPPAQASLHAAIHGLAAEILFALMPISCLAFLRRFRADPDWRVLQGWTLALGAIIAAAVILLAVALQLPDRQNIFTDWLGLLQRTAIVPFMLWIFLFACKLQRRGKRS